MHPAGIADRIDLLTPQTVQLQWDRILFLLDEKGDVLPEGYRKLLEREGEGQQYLMEEISELDSKSAYQGAKKDLHDHEIVSRVHGVRVGNLAI